MVVMFDANRLPIPDLGLRCTRCGYPLAHLSEHCCPECGWAFTMDDVVPPGDFPPLFADGKPVRGEPRVLDLLRTYQVPYVTLTDPSLGVFGMVRTSRAVGDPLAVPRERYLEVVDLLRRQKLAEPMPPPPEAITRGENWTCPGCGEMNPANFEICWNCEQAPDDQAVV